MAETNASVVLVSSQIVGNAAASYGGGGIVDDGYLSLSDVSVIGNTAATYGGGLVGRISVVAVHASVVTRNGAAAGSGPLAAQRAGFFTCSSVPSSILAMRPEILMTSGSTSICSLFLSSRITCVRAAAVRNKSRCGIMSVADARAAPCRASPRGPPLPRVHSTWCPWQGGRRGCPRAYLFDNDGRHDVREREKWRALFPPTQRSCRSRQNLAAHVPLPRRRASCRAGRVLP